uniref:Uncharacterized protein n=1 Tax=Heterorhabditis bacteriophora TaxID=37862 RepID=A0A1I7XF08_HETBA
MTSEGRKLVILKMSSATYYMNCSNSAKPLN